MRQGMFLLAPRLETGIAVWQESPHQEYLLLYSSMTDPFM